MHIEATRELHSIVLVPCWYRDAHRCRFMSTGPFDEEYEHGRIPGLEIDTLQSRVSSVEWSEASGQEDAVLVDPSLGDLIARYRGRPKKRSSQADRRRGDQEHDDARLHCSSHQEVDASHRDGEKRSQEFRGNAPSFRRGVLAVFVRGEHP